MDSNVVLRYLLNDHPDHSPRAKYLFEEAERGSHRLKVAAHILREIVYVLEGEGYSRPDICNALRQFFALRGVLVEDKRAVHEALLEFRDKGVDFSDALLAAIARGKQQRVWTFNKRQFSRMSVAWDEPPAHFG
ncbi:MAG: PIN domain-containing protein [Firmicutes bacterium]|nr:PIN domain-containing protein [Bacillota bacterium]